MSVKVTPIARERRHTLCFLESIRASSPVYLDTEVDMTRVRAHQGTSARRCSVLAYVLYVAARTIARHPEANAAIRGRLGARVARYPFVNGKVTLDKLMNGHRIVLSTVLPGLDTADLDGIQTCLEHFRDGDPQVMPEFAATRMLQRLPWPLGLLAFRLGVRPLHRRANTMGTFAVTSLAYRPVDGFYSVGGTTITLGAGRTTDRPVIRDGALAVAPVMRLSLTFDHRVIDGAEAADVLAEIRDSLESF